MPDILHRVGISASTESVYDALSTIEGLSRWWIVGASGSTRLGGTIHFRTDGGGVDLQVLDFALNRFVKWKCIGGPPEWIGTEIHLQLESRREQTIVMLTHSGWRDATEFMHQSSTKWATYLLSLKGWLERSEGRPFPYDIKIHVGD